MTKQKTTKRALLSSVLSLVLCMAMLIGTTFAWFTDSVTSSGNIIKSGTLDVTMEWKDATATGKQTSYVDASQGAIFNYDLWEPGYVEAKNVKINNIGTLALQYDLHITANGAVSELADVIDVYFAEGEKTLADRDMSELTRVGTLNEVLKGMPANMTGDLLADTSDAVTIALKMQENADNKYQGLSIGTNFSVVLMATQDNVEKDSFDENYDDIEIPNKDIKVIDGNTYYYCDDGNVVLVTVPYGNVGSTFTMRDDVTILGRGDTYAEGKPVFSKSSPINTITLNEGLKEIKARAITGVKTLTSINFPSSLEIVGVQSLAQSGMTDLRIPATVKEIKYGAFTTSPKLTTVTIEGNTRLDNYVFRDCANLESIYLLGDDVQFIGGGMFATNKQNGDASKITIYVKNATVAARLCAAQSSAYGYEVKILGDSADGSDAEEITYVKNDAELESAIMSASTTDTNTIVLASGTYSSNYELTLAHLGEQKGDFEFLAGGDVIFSGTTTLGYRNQGVAATMLNANVTFDGITFDHAETTKHSLDIQDVKSLTLKDCTIIGNGEHGIGCARGNATGASSIVGCTFIDAGMQLLGNFATGLVIDDCDFDNSCINVQAGIGVTIQNCTFNNTLTDANVGESFYLIRSNSTPITVKDCDITIDSIVNGIATAQEKWGIFWNRGTTNWTVSNVTVDLTDAAVAQTELLITKTTSTGAINGTVDVK